LVGLALAIARYGGLRHAVHTRDSAAPAAGS
jgi:hypothetical protein